MQRFCILLLLLTFASCKTRSTHVAPAPVAVKQPVKDSIISKLPKEIIHQRKFILTLLLPLNARQYLEKDSVGNYLIADLDPACVAALEFLEGLQFARKIDDSLVNLNVIDAGTDSIKFLKLLNDSLIIKSDLVVSMLNPSQSPALLKASLTYGFSLMFPNGQPNSMSSGNNKIWAAAPSNKTQCKRMLSFLKNKYPNANFSVVYRSEYKRESDLADLFNVELQYIFSDSVKRKIDYAKDGWEKMSGKLKTGQRNVLIIPSSDESFLSGLLVKLETKEEFYFIIAGLPTWDRFESIDQSLFERLNTCIFNTSFLDYDNDNVKRFRKSFIEKYHADPLYSAYSGYDIYQWIVSNYTAFGNGLEKYKSSTSLTAPGAGFKFEKSCDNCMNENQFISILFFKDGKLKKAE